MTFPFNNSFYPLKEGSFSGDKYWNLVSRSLQFEIYAVKKLCKMQSPKCFRHILTWRKILCAHTNMKMPFLGLVFNTFVLFCNEMYQTCKGKTLPQKECISTHAEFRQNIVNYEV